MAATLKGKGRRPLVIEKSTQVGASWRNHYQRLHLHTVKALSALPGLPFPDEAPRYVPRQGVVDYLAAYAARAGIEPCFGEEADGDRPRPFRPLAHLDPFRPDLRLRRRRSSPAARTTIRSRRRSTARSASARGGRIVHSRDYRDATPFAGERVLVVGMGNTGAEIALDLAEHGVAVALSVRSPVNIVHRDVLGRPTQQTSIMLARLPTPIGDALARLLCDVTVGDIGRYGLPRSRVSPLRQLREEGRTPVIDVGTLARIKSGEIAVFPGIRRLVAGGAEFVDGRTREVRCHRPRHRLSRRRGCAVSRLHGAGRRQRPADAAGGNRRARRRLLRRLRRAPGRRPAAHDRRAGALGRRADRRRSRARPRTS